MSTNFLFDQTWELLHWSQSLLKGGWDGKVPAIPEMKGELGAHLHPRGKRVSQLIQKYQPHYLGREPLWKGSVEPELLVVCNSISNPASHPLSLEEEEYTHKWYVAINLDPSKVFLINLPSLDHPELVPVFFQDLYVILQPKCLLTLGEEAARAILQVQVGLESLRGRDHMILGCPLLPTYHPANVLENRDLRNPVWQDIQRVKGILGYDPPVA